MLRKSRLYFSAVLSALVLASLLLTTNVKACEEAPQTLLSLYMNSELIVIARFESESEPKKNNEDEYGHTLDSQRTLVITKVYKGQADLKSVVLPHSTYVPKPQPNNTETETETEEDHHMADYGFDLSQIKLGGEYVFFLTKNKENGEYSVTDYVSGVRETGKNLAALEKNMSELEQIAAAKENQYELLTEWMVRNLENPDTRDDAIGDLSEAFYGLTYQDEDPNYKGKGPFVVSEDGYGLYTVGVAKHLTAAQKERISGVLYPLLQAAWFAETAEYANYGIGAILGGINKSRLAVYAYNSMQSVAKTDVQRRRVIGEFLTDSIGDEDFSKLFYEAVELENKMDEAKGISTPQGRKQLKDLTVLRDAKLKELDKQFKLLLGRNFAPVETKAA